MDSGRGKLMETGGIRSKLTAEYDVSAAEVGVSHADGRRGIFKTNTSPPALHAILEGLETDSAKSSLGLLGDLIEGHVFSFFFFFKFKKFPLYYFRIF